MLGEWGVEKSFSSYNYLYNGEDNILRYVASFENNGTINIYIRCAESDKTKESIKRVQQLFISTIEEIQSNESLEQQCKLADLKNEKFKLYPESALAIPKFELRKESFRASWINGKYRQLGVKTRAGRYVSIFINVLDLVFNLGEIAEKMHTSFKIKPIYANLISLKLYVDNGRYEDAINHATESAKCPRYQNIQFELAQYLEEKDQSELAYQVYNSIKPDHPIFEKAQERKYYLIQDTKSALELESIPQSVQDKNNLAVTELDTMMQLPKEQQFLVDQRIHELCGMKDLKPVLTNVRYDGETILAFCNHIKALNEKIAGLEILKQTQRK